MQEILYQRLRAKRLEKGWSQTELARGICEQSQISRIEKGVFSPGSDILYALSRKLGTTMDYFFDENVTDDAVPLQNIKHFRGLVDDLLEAQDYEKLAYYHQVEMNKYKHLVHADQYYLDWVGAVLLAEYEKNPNAAIEVLENLRLHLDKVDTLYLRLMHALSVFYYEAGNSERYAELYEELKFKLSEADLDSLTNIKLYLRVVYHHIDYLGREGDLHQALDEAFEAVKFSMDNKVIFLFPSFLFWIGNVAKELLPKDEAYKFYKDAEDLLRILGPEKCIYT